MPEFQVIDSTPRPKMSPADYERERQELRKTYGDNKQQAGARFEQALAKLFYRTAWNQEELAKREGKSQPWVSYRLLFGQFLTFITDVINRESGSTGSNSGFPLDILTEFRFRAYWARTDKADNYRARFRAAYRLMQEELSLRNKTRPKIGKMIIDKFADGKWHVGEIIAKHVESDVDHVHDTLVLVRKYQTYGANCEFKPMARGGYSYRIFKIDRTIGTEEIKTKLLPLIEGLEEQGRQHAAMMSVGTVARLAALLRRQIDEWAEGRNGDDAHKQSATKHRASKR